MSLKRKDGFLQPFWARSCGKLGVRGVAKRALFCLLKKQDSYYCASFFFCSVWDYNLTSRFSCHLVGPYQMYFSVSPASCLSSSGKRSNWSPFDFFAGQLKKQPVGCSRMAEPLTSLPLLPTASRARGGTSPVDLWRETESRERVYLLYRMTGMDCDVPLAELTFSRECPPSTLRFISKIGSDCCLFFMLLMLFHF